MRMFESGFVRVFYEGSSEASCQWKAESLSAPVLWIMYTLHVYTAMFTAALTGAKARTQFVPVHLYLNCGYIYDRNRVLRGRSVVYD
jgi:hypothetical protein